MKKLLIAVSMCFCLATTNFALADESVQPAVLTPLKKGQVAPYDGVELSPAAVADIIADKQTSAETCAAKIAKDVDTVKATCKRDTDTQKSNCDSDKKSMQIRMDSQAKQIEILTKDLQKSSNVAWWTAGGFVGGVLLTTATVFVIGLATK